MASFLLGGTTQKCQVCQKTVYLVEQLIADGRIYHRACFRCHHCKGTLKFSNYSSIDGVLYCKPHYDQLFKMTGRLDKSFEGASKSAKIERSNGQLGGASSRFSSVFLGTQDKCVECKKTVYPIEKVAVNGNSYHRPCFRCSHGGCTISPSNFITHEGRLYCKHHLSQLFMTKGDFSCFNKVEEDKRQDPKLPEVTINEDLQLPAAKVMINEDLKLPEAVINEDQNLPAVKAMVTEDPESPAVKAMVNGDPELPAVIAMVNEDPKLPDGKVVLEDQKLPPGKVMAEDLKLPAADKVMAEGVQVA